MMDGLFDFLRDPRGSNRAKFRAFHAENPHIYKLFKKWAFDAMAAGHLRYSAREILGAIRWHTTVVTIDPAGFKINNLWSPYYARLFDEEFPVHVTFFEKRRSQADEQLDGLGI